MNKKENIYSFKGFSKVMLFTARQTFKNKAYIASLIIFVMCMSFMGPIQYIMARNSENTARSMLETDYTQAVTDTLNVWNETEVPLTYIDINGTDAVRKLGKIKLYVHDEFEETQPVFDETCMHIFITYDQDAGTFLVKGIISDDSKIPASEADNVVSLVASAFYDARMRHANITDEDITLINAGVNFEGVYSVDDYYAEENKTVSSGSYMLYAVGFSVIVMIVVSMSTSFIIASVTEEKQSKLVESLLVSVRPMALIMGKIAGMLSYVLSIIFMGFIGSKISDLIMKMIFKDEYSAANTSGMNFNIFGMFGTTGFIIMALALAVGYLTFAIFGGIMGSACSKPEDTQSATGSVMMLVMMGYMGAIFGGIPDSNIVNLCLSLIPPFSYFTAPIMYVTGRIELWTFLVSLLLQVIILALLMLLCAKTYRNLILSDSSTPKLKAIFKFAK